MIHDHAQWVWPCQMGMHLKTLAERDGLLRFFTSFFSTEDSLWAPGYSNCCTVLSEPVFHTFLTRFLCNLSEILLIASRLSPGEHWNIELRYKSRKLTLTLIVPSNVKVDLADFLKKTFHCRNILQIFFYFIHNVKNDIWCLFSGNNIKTWVQDKSRQAVVRCLQSVSSPRPCRVWGWRVLSRAFLRGLLAPHFLENSRNRSALSPTNQILGKVNLHFMKGTLKLNGVPGPRFN